MGLRHSLDPDAAFLWSSLSASNTCVNDLPCTVSGERRLIRSGHPYGNI